MKLTQRSKQTNDHSTRFKYSAIESLTIRITAQSVSPQQVIEKIRAYTKIMGKQREVTLRVDIERAVKAST